MAASNGRVETPILAVGPHIFPFEGAPAGGPDRILALLEGGEISLDAACVAILFERDQHLLGAADRRAVGLGWVYAESEAHHLQFTRRHHGCLAALEYINQGWPPDLATNDAQLL